MIFDDLAAALRAADSGAFRGLPYAETLGLHFEKGASGLVIVMPWSDSLVGSPMPPRLHGGAVAGLLEITAIAALLLALPEGKPVPGLKPITVTVDYLRAGAPAPTYAAATISRLGRRVANLRAEAWQDDRSKPIAGAHMNVMLARD